MCMSRTLVPQNGKSPCRGIELVVDIRKFDTANGQRAHQRRPVFGCTKRNSQGSAPVLTAINIMEILCQQEFNSLLPKDVAS